MMILYLLYLTFCFCSKAILFCCATFCSIHFLKKSSGKESIIFNSVTKIREILASLTFVNKKTKLKDYIYTHFWVIKPDKLPALLLNITYLTWHRNVIVGLLVCPVVVFPVEILLPPEAFILPENINFAVLLIIKFPFFIILKFLVIQSLVKNSTVKLPFLNTHFHFFM